MAASVQVRQILAALVVVVLQLAVLGTVAEQRQPPNIVFIFADDLGWADVSFHGSGQIPTPNMDAMAADGVVLNNYYVQPVCTPSRAALMTGLYPIHTGMQSLVIQVGEAWGLPLGFKLMPQHFKDLGYATHMVGKWHLGYHEDEYTPTYRGFDTFYGYYNGEEDYYNHTLREGEHFGLDFWEGVSSATNESGHYSTTLFTDKAVDLIKSHNASEPFFLYLSHQAPHGGVEVPLAAPKENIDKFAYIGEENRTVYAAMVDALDESVGAVVEALQAASMLDNSVLVFSSDNGGAPWGTHASRGCNWPLRGAKGSLWEGASRAAAFLWSPLLAARGRVSQQLMHVADWLPTLYAAAGGDPTSLDHLDGFDMWRHLSEDIPSPRSDILYNIDPVSNTAALRHGDHKLVLGTASGGRYDERSPIPGSPRPDEDLDELASRSKAAGALRLLYNNASRTGATTAQWRQEASLQCDDTSESSNFVSGAPPYLFDLSKDPCELHNLADTEAELLASMKRKLEEYEATAMSPRLRQVDPNAFPESHSGVWAPWQ
ncbi:arylsulfatase B-like [Dermacentor albipictus]|uniref:arylsulfatase B-like n=1 Tax=Dermacentor albipictus TaxID=60249 RepID=UPI0031FC08F2